jgi:multiple sugar transport system substrate-binding protein
MALLLAACSAEPTPLPESAEARSSAAQSAAPVAAATLPPVGEPITLRFMSWSESGFGADFATPLKDFQAANPGIKIDQITDAGDYNVRLADRLSQASKAPDVFDVSPYALTEFISRQALLNLTPLMRMDASIGAGFVPGLLEVGQQGTSQYAIPLGWNPYYMMLNIDLFDKAGVPLPPDDWTLDQYVELAAKLNKSGDRSTSVFGTGFETRAFGIDASVLSFLLSNEGARWFKDGKSNLSDPAAVRGLQRMADLVVVDKSAPAEADLGVVGVSTWQLFSRNRIAMFPVVRAAVPFFTRDAKFKWTVRELPRGATRVNPYFVPHMMAINANSRHPEAALTLIKFLMTNKAQAQMSKTSIMLPPLQAQMRDPALLPPEAPDAKVSLAAMAYHGDPSQLDMLRTGKTEIYFSTIIEPELKLMLAGKQSPEVTARKIDEKANTTLYPTP